jgi:hypothetical protein
LEPRVCSPVRAKYNAAGNHHLLAKVEISFDSFPCGPWRLEVDRALHAVHGINKAEFQDCVRRISACFDPSKVSISQILAALESCGAKPKVVSVISPCFHGANPEQLETQGVD